MSKTTKIIAALGVVAGLGVAALPAFTYAADPASTTGNVEVDVEVLPAIAMTIEGNNDDGEYYNNGVAFTYTAATPATGDNPSAKGWYERSGTDLDYVYTKTTDTEVEAGTTYYVRSSAFNPVDSFAPAGAASSEIDGHETPASSITALSSSYTSLLPNSVQEGGAFKSTVTVYTNATSGYTLVLNDADGDTDLVHVSNSSYTIPAIDSANSVVALTGGTAAWGYRVGTSGDWLAVPTSTATGGTIGEENTKTDDGTEYTVEYGVATAADQATGVYKDTIVYTATTK